MNARTRRAKEMMEQPGFAAQITNDEFRVRSQTDLEKSYIVSRTGNGLVCECPDHQTRKADCKHIKVVLEIAMKNKGYKNSDFRIMERSKLNLCKFCDSGNIIKKGFKNNKSGKVQKFQCNDCGRAFTANFGFEKKQYDPETITLAIQAYYQGASTRDIADSLEMAGVDVSHMTVYRWVAEYSWLVDGYLEGIVPRSPGRAMVRADEIWIKIAGEQKYLFASMEDDSRYWLASEMAHTKFQHNADNLLGITKRQMGKSPAHFVTDGLPAYMKSSKKVFGKKTNHIRHIHIYRRIKVRDHSSGKPGIGHLI